MSLSKIKLFYTILCSLTLIVVFTTCKKYDEDGKRSWHKPEKRLLGTWYLKEFLVDGVDSVYDWFEYKTNDVTDTIRWRLFDTGFNFEDTKKVTVMIYTPNIYINNSHNHPYSYMLLENKWQVEKSKNELFFNSKYNYQKDWGIITVSFSLFGNVTDLWDIKKLTDKEMILEAYNNDNKHLRLKFQK